MKETTLLTSPKDKGGSIASARLDYQKDWSLCRMIEAHESADDYVFIFEHDDDLMMLVAKDGKEEISFYQVKTKELGHWTLTDLLRKKSSKTGNSLSMLGRLYANKIKYDSSTSSLNLVSNARFKVSLASGKDSEKKTDICVSECSTKDVDKVVLKLKEEHAMTTTPDIGILYFKVSNLSLDDSSTHTTGKIADFLSKISPDGDVRATIAYQSLFNEIRRRCNYSGECNTFDDLKKFKSITRIEFAKMLEVISQPPSAKKFDDLWSATQQRLNLEGMDLRAIIEIRLQWIKFIADSTNSSDELHIEFVGIISELVAQAVAVNGSISNMTTFMSDIVTSYKDTEFYKSNGEVYNVPYIMASVLNVYYEESKLPEAGKKSNQETI